MKQGWEIVTLGDLCELVTKGTTPTSLGYNFVDNGINFIKIESIDSERNFIQNKIAFITPDCNNSLRRSQLRKGDILFSIAGALGRTALVTDEILPANTNQALAIIRLRPMDYVSTDFILLTLESGLIFDQVNKFKGGVAQQNISLEQVKSFKIPLPPLPEQQRIVAIIDEAFASIAKAKANAEKNLKNAKEIFESYMLGVFQRKGEGWEEKKVKGLGLTKTGTTPKTAEKENYGDFIPFIKPADVDFSGIGDLRYNNEGLSEIGLKKGRKMDGGSILMVCIGATIGKVGFTECEVSCNQQINSLTVKPEFEPKFFYYAMSSKEFQEKVFLEGKGAQATLPIINKSKWENLTISFPKTKTEQQTIVCKLDALRAETQKMEAIYKQKLTDFEELKKSILQRAFSGDLRVGDYAEPSSGRVKTL